MVCRASLRDLLRLFKCDTVLLLYTWSTFFLFLFFLTSYIVSKNFNILISSLCMLQAFGVILYRGGKRERLFIQSLVTQECFSLFLLSCIFKLLLLLYMLFFFFDPNKRFYTVLLKFVLLIVSK